MHGHHGNKSNKEIYRQIYKIGKYIIHKIYKSILYLTQKYKKRKQQLEKK